ncbi:hypothetical protein [Amycolatopsis nalaikhensis]|uniref:Uncharacterized protein n=1 Tax=Amycolatopsis nalaikhensis TaxID=715472 RepID=A0ABY8XJV4_9PSEU|nr:hypothetical protein [Amycolatopsis sp. 2-2]WIV55923.1 hypothetical protein QP939_45180 [Amycolatopsis sp. 2-2]
MAAMFEQYTREMRAQFDYLSAWPPHTHLELGDVGILRRDKFERQTTLTELGIPFKVRQRSRDIDLDYCSAGNVSITVSGSADAVAAGPLRIAVSFAREHGVVFQAKACHSTEIADRYTLGRTVLALAEAGRWPRDHVVITELLGTGPAVVLVSSNHDARIELAATVPAPLDALPLASASAALDVVSSRGIGVKFIAPDGLTPLFRASGVRRRFFGEDRFEHRGEDNGNGAPLAGDLPGAPAEFVEFDYEDLA